MKTFIRNTLLAAAGLAALSLPAHAQRPYDPSAGSVGFKQTTTRPQLAQRPYDPSAGSVGYKKSMTLAQRPYDPSAGSVGYKKSKSKKKAKAKK